MLVRRLLAATLLLTLGVGLSQPNGSWTVDSEIDPYSYGGLGSIWLPAFQHPDDLTAADALLVVGCDANSPTGFEIAAWVAPLGTHVFEGEGALADTEIAVLVRFDQGPVLRQAWFLAEGYFQIEAVAYYALNEALLDGLGGAATMALRVQADAGRAIRERTFQYDVSGFDAALAELRCGSVEEGSAPPVEPVDDGGATDPFADPFADPSTDPFADVSTDAITEPGDEDVVAEPLRVGDWLFDGEAGMTANGESGAVGVYCAADPNGIEIEVGDYALTAPAYDVRFRSGNVEFLRTTATLNQYAAAQLEGDDVEDRLVRFLRGVVDLTVTITPTSGDSGTLQFTVPTVGFNDAIARLGCYLGGR